MRIALTRTLSVKTLQTDLPLAGIRVLDFSTTIAGPSATRHMADFGAEVIKVESSVHPDTARIGSPYRDGIAGPNRSGYFSAYNAGKLSITLNLQIRESIDLVRRLVQVSDLLVEAFTPGVMARRGMSYERVRAWNPRIIMASHSLQGQTGPHAGHRGYGQLASALTGWFDLTGLPDEDPVGPFSAYTDFIAWPVLLSSILLALELRDSTGEGQYIDHSHVDSSAYFAAPELFAAQLGSPPRRDGNHEQYACPNNAYRCAGDDRWCAITVQGDDEWRLLCSLLEAAELASDPRFASHDARKAHEATLDDLLSQRTAAWDAFELAERLTAQGIAAGAVYRAEDLFADPQLRHRRGFRQLTHAEHGSHHVAAPAFSLRGVDSGPHRAFPSLGEHTLSICRYLLGLSDDELATYAVAGVFE